MLLSRIKLANRKTGGLRFLSFPTAFDRLIAIKMGTRAVDLLLEGKAGRVVGIRDNSIVDYDINDALSMELLFDKNLYNEHYKRMSY